MTYRPQPLVHHAWANPPSCLAEVTAEPLREPSRDFDLHDALACFRVACPCGSTGWHVLGHRQTHPDTQNELFLSPLSLQCERCDCVIPVFDIEKHGYDAVACGSCWSLRGGEPQRWSCRHCGGIAFEAYPCFSYQFNAEDFDKNGTFSPAASALIQDCFDCFLLNARCKACGAVSAPIGYECA